MDVQSQILVLGASSPAIVESSLVFHCSTKRRHLVITDMEYADRSLRRASLFEGSRAPAPMVTLIWLRRTTTEYLTHGLALSLFLNQAFTSLRMRVPWMSMASATRTGIIGPLISTKTAERAL